MQKLIKINADHYIVVDDSEITTGDIVAEKLLTDKYELFTIHTLNDIDKQTQKKITHSTQPLEDVGLGKYDLRFNKIFALDLDEIKELIGEKSWKGYIDGTEWEVEIVDGKFKLK